MNKIILVIPVFIASAIMAFPLVAFPGDNIMVITSDSMLPALKPNDLIIVRPSSIDEINQDDIIAFDSHMHGVGIIAHRAIEIFDDHGQIGIHTKGDNNGFSDPWIVHDEDLIGKVIQILPGMGILIGDYIRFGLLGIIIIVFIFLLRQTMNEKKKQSLIF